MKSIIITLVDVCTVRYLYLYLFISTSVSLGFYAKRKEIS